MPIVLVFSDIYWLCIIAVVYFDSVHQLVVFAQ